MKFCPCLGGGDDATNEPAGQYAASQGYAAGGIPGQASMGGHCEDGQLGVLREEEDQEFDEFRPSNPETQSIRICRLGGNDLIRAIQRGEIQDFVGGSYDQRREPTTDQRRVVEKVQEHAAAHSWLALSAMAGDALRTARELREVKPQWARGIYHIIATCYFSLSQYGKAMELFEQALAISKELGDHEGQRNVCEDMGRCYQSLGQYTKAIELHEQALTASRAGHDLTKVGESLFVRLGYRSSQGEAWDDLGNCYYKLGQYAKAMKLFEQSLAIDKELGNRAGQGERLQRLGNCYYSLDQYDKAMELFEQALVIFQRVGDRAGQRKAWQRLGNCYQSLGQYAKAIEFHEQCLTVAEVGNRAAQGDAWGNLGQCYLSLGQYGKAIDLYKLQLSVVEEVGDRAMEGRVCNHLGVALVMNDDATGATRVFLRGLAVLQRVEEDVGAHDDRRVSLFEEQQRTYSLLQTLLMQQGRAAWALGVVAQGKARALAYRLGGVGGGPGDGGVLDSDDGNQSADRPYEEVCESWWVEVQRLAGGEKPQTRVIEFSFLTDDKVGIWVVSGGTGELMCTAIVGITWLCGSRGIQAALAEARKSMGVRGRDAMREARDALCASSCETTELLDALHATHEAASSGRGWATKEDLIKAERKKVQSAREKLSELMIELMQRLNDLKDIVLAGQHVQNLLQEAEIRVDESHPDKLVNENSIGDLEEREKILRESLDALVEVKGVLEDKICKILLKELYRALIAPVEAALVGAEELLIVPNKELFEVPWAALTDAEGRYLIERHVIRIAPSLRVARQLADKMQEHGSEKGGHALVVGNPWPNSSGRLEYAEREAQSVAHMLREKRFQVDLHVTIDATKRRVSHGLKGVAWAHFSCHADKDTQSLLLATPYVSRMGADEWALMKSLSMKDVETEVEMVVGSTVVLSACNTGRGEIKAEGVVGLARGFLSAGAAATVVSLWSVDDGSTASLMEHMYTQIAQGKTVPQALRSSMLRLARCNPADGLPEEWLRPYHWAGFVVVGATTRLPLHKK